MEFTVDIECRRGRRQRIDHLSSNFVCLLACCVPGCCTDFKGPDVKIKRNAVSLQSIGILSLDS